MAVNKGRINEEVWLCFVQWSIYCTTIGIFYWQILEGVRSIKGETQVNNGQLREIDLF